MKRSTLGMVAVLAAGVLLGWLATGRHGPTALAQQKPGDPAAPGAAQPPAKADGPEAGIQAVTAEGVSVPAFYQWKRVLAAGDTVPPHSRLRPRASS